MATDIDLPAEALFTSDLSAFTHHTQASVQAAIRRAIRAHGGIRGCAGEVAAAYGEHPETAAPRMRWARAVAEDISVPAEHLAPPPPPGTTPPRPGSRLAVDPPAGASGPSRGGWPLATPGLHEKNQVKRCRSVLP
jgi:hypothetical protein